MVKYFLKNMQRTCDNCKKCEAKALTEKKISDIFLLWLFSKMSDWSKALESTRS